MIRSLALAMLFLAPSIAYAQPAPISRTIDMTAPLKDDHGKPMIDQLEAVPDAKDPAKADCSKCGPLTVGHAIAHALFADLPQERTPQGYSTVTAEQRWARGALADRIKDDPKATLSAKEVTVIEKVVGEAYGTSIIMQVFPLLDPNAKPPEVQ